MQQVSLLTGRLGASGRSAAGTLLPFEVGQIVTHCLFPPPISSLKPAPNAALASVSAAAYPVRVQMLKTAAPEDPSLAQRGRDVP